MMGNSEEPGIIPLTIDYIFRAVNNIRGREFLLSSKPEYDSEMFESYRATGNIMKKKPPGPARTVRMPENIDRVMGTLIQSPRRSARQHARELQMNCESVRRILWLELHFHPYKMLGVHLLQSQNYAA
ncbi:hypothetical protein C0J52_21500 [Blattella germanica]|nr:hypothetical protein C0J52_21500 [Blattella germanica]